MEKYIVFIILAVVFYYVHRYCVQSEVEKFLNTKKVIENFGDAVTVDGVDDNNAINTLAKIAKDLQEGGGLKVKGNLIVDRDSIKGPIPNRYIFHTPEDDRKGLWIAPAKDDGATDWLWGNGINLNRNGNHNFGGNVSMNGGVSVTGTGNDKIQNPNGSLRMNNQGIMFGGPNNGKEVNSAQIAAGLHKANSLNIVGMSSGAGYQDRKVDMWAEGGFNINGSLIVGGRNILDELDEIKRNYVKKNNDMYIKVGKRKDGSNLYPGHHVIVHGDANIAAWGTPVQATKFQMVDDAV